MVTRTRRRRLSSRGLTACKLHELLTGEVKLLAQGYDGYAPGGRLTVTAQLRADWARHRDDVLTFWASGKCTGGVAVYLTPDSDPIRGRPWLFIWGRAGTRPWVWWELDAPEPLGDEDEAEYLDRHGLLLAGERELIVEQADARIAELHERLAFLTGPRSHPVTAAGDEGREGEAAELGARIAAMSELKAQYT